MMTALAAVPDTSARSVPWSRLAWVVWRRYRNTLAGIVGVLGLLAVDLVITGIRERSAYSAVLACAPADSAQCRFEWENFHSTYAQVGLVGVILVLIPGLVGVFAGAPILGHELETGTFRYAWTQGVGRIRWAIALLVPGAVAVAVIMGAFGVLVAWQEQPLLNSGITQRLHPTDFCTTGLAIAGWAFAGFGIGTLAGILWRHVVPALVTAAAAWFGLAFLTADTLRPNYLAPLTTTDMEVPGNGVTVSQWWTHGGVRVGEGQLNSVLSSVGLQMDNTQKVVEASPGSASGSVDPVQYLLQHGYLQVTSYQPDNRYWTFQWIEFGWLTGLTVLTLGVSIWLVRRRTA